MNHFLNISKNIDNIEMDGKKPIGQYYQLGK